MKQSAVFKLVAVHTSDKLLACVRNEIACEWQVPYGIVSFRIEFQG